MWAISRGRAFSWKGYSGKHRRYCAAHYAAQPQAARPGTHNEPCKNLMVDRENGAEHGRKNCL